MSKDKLKQITDKTRDIYGDEIVNKVLKKSSKLKSCPFCGGKAVIFKRLSWRFVPKRIRNQVVWEIGCQDSLCICWIPPKGLDQSENGYVVKGEAISSWNRRKI